MEDQENNQGQDPNDNQESLGWRAALPDTLKNHDAVKDFTKPGDFVQSAINAAEGASWVQASHDELTGKLEKAIFKPGEDATPEDVSAYNKALGVPDSSDEYEFPDTGIEHDEEMMKWSRDIFHKNGLTKEQGAEISKSWDGFVQGMYDAQVQTAKEASDTANEKLKTDWGNDYDNNLELTKRAFQKFSNTELDAFFDETGIGNHSVLIRAFHEIGKALGEDFSPKSKGSGSERKVDGIIKYDMPDFP